MVLFLFFQCNFSRIKFYELFDRLNLFILGLNYHLLCSDVFIFLFNDLIFPFDDSNL